MADTFGQIGDALSGIGAGLTGQGLQFRQQLQNRRATEESRRQEQLKKQKQDALERQKTVFTDSLSGLKLVNQGRFDLAAQLANNRFDTLSQSFPGVDSSETQGIVQLSNIAASGGEGAEEAQKLLKKTLENNVKIGRAQGVLPEEEKRKLVDAKEGTATFLNPDGSVSQEAIQGALKKDGGIKFSDFRSINKDVGAIASEPLKIRAAASRLAKIAKTKSATDQLAAIFTFMKALDPASVVREGEQRQASSTGGITDQFIGFINKIRGEGALPSAVFDNMVMTAKNLSNQAAVDARDQISGFLDAFGDRIKRKDMDRLLARSPKLFDVANTKISPGGRTTSGAPSFRNLSDDELLRF